MSRGADIVLWACVALAVVLILHNVWNDITRRRGRHRKPRTPGTSLAVPARRVRLADLFDAPAPRPARKVWTPPDLPRPGSASRAVPPATPVGAGPGQYNEFWDDRERDDYPTSPGTEVIPTVEVGGIHLPLSGAGTRPLSAGELDPDAPWCPGCGFANYSSGPCEVCGYDDQNVPRPGPAHTSTGPGGFHGRSTLTPPWPTSRNMSDLADTLIDSAPRIRPELRPVRPDPRIPCTQQPPDWLDELLAANLPAGYMRALAAR